MVTFPSRCLSEKMFTAILLHVNPYRVNAHIKAMENKDE